MAFFFDSDEKQLRPKNYSPLSESQIRKDYQYFKERLHQEILRSQRRHHPFTLMRVAIDSSPAETVPDSDVGNLVEENIREYDVFCHVQAAEFAIVLPETNEKYAEKIAERIRQKIVKSKQNLGPLSSAPSIGIACFPYDGTNAEDLLESAEQDLDHQRRRFRS
jgi:GGDEF domain-containing protein